LSVSKNPNVRLSVQPSSRGPIIVIFDPDSKALQILDSNLRLLYKYNVNTPHEVKNVPHVTENLIFVLTAPLSESISPSHKLLVFSRIFSEEKSTTNSLYQEFMLPVFEHVKGIFFPTFNRPLTTSLASINMSTTSISSNQTSSNINIATKSSGKLTQKHRPKSVRSYVEVSPMSLMLAAHAGKGTSEATNSSSSISVAGTQKDLFSYARTRGNPGISEAKSEIKSIPVYFDERGEEEYEESYVDESQIEGVFFWTEDALYELRSVVSPEELFFKLIEKVERKKQGEELGITFSLDVCKLFELSADEHFRRGELGPAHSLYHLSNVSTPKLIRQWLSVGRMNEPISALRVLLMGAKVGEAKRPRVANELIRCHIQRLLNPSKQTNLRKLLNVNERCRDEELESFLKNNPDYEEREIRALFNQFGLIRFNLIVAKAKANLRASLESLASQRGISYLSMEHLRFISENNAIEAGTLKVDDANTLHSHFPPNIQLLHYLTAVSNIQNTLPRIQDLITELDDESLGQICRFFDPQGPFVGPMLHSQDHQHHHQQQLHNQSQSSPSRRRTGNQSNEQIDSSEQSRPSKAHSSSSSTSSTLVASSFMDSKKFVSQCVELYLTALIRLNRNSNALPQSWKHQKQQVESLSTSIDLKTSEIESFSPQSSLSLSINDSSSSSSTTMIDTNVGIGFQQQLSPRKPGGVLELSAELKSMSRGLRTRKAVSAICGFHHTALLTENGQVFTWGAGSKGQLGHENVSDTLWVPKSVAGLSMTSIGEKVWKIACGGNHTLALTQSGQLYAFGSNARGQLGFGDRDDRSEPRQVIFDEQRRLEMGNILDMSAGFWHSVLITDKGGVWSSGANSSQASTALHSEMGDQLLFTSVSNVPIENFVMVRCGFGHTALLTKRGRVYTFGSNENGQLGIGRGGNPSISSASDHPQQVRGLLDDKHIIDIACGSFSTFAVSEVYSVYAWGLGSKNRLGVLHPSERAAKRGGNNDIQRPTSPLPRYDVGGIVGGGGGVGGVGGGGNLDFGQFDHLHGSSTTSNNHSSNDVEEFEESLPVRIDSLQGLEITRIFAGPSHSFATSSDGKVFVWGDCNTPMKAKTSDPRLPALLNRWSDSPLVSIGCGDDFSVCILENGLVYTFGRGMCGQLGHNDQVDNFEARQAFLNTSLVVEDASTSDSILNNNHHHHHHHHHHHSSSGNLDQETTSGEKTKKIHSREPSYGNLSNIISSSSLSSSTTTYLAMDHLPSIQEGSENQQKDSSTLSQSSIINVASGISTYSDPLLLEHSLQILAKRYRPSVILHQCFLTFNLAAAALILEQCGAWAASVDCKIRLLRREFPKMESGDVAYQTHLLTELIKDLAQPHVPPFARQEGLKQVVSLWKQVGASTSTLENMLKGSTTLISALASLLEYSSSNNLCGFEFSAKFMLKVVQAGLEQQKRNYSAKRANYGDSTKLVPHTGSKPFTSSSSSASSTMSTNTEISGKSGSILNKDPAWNERKAYFERDIKLRTKIQISQPALEDYIQHAYPSPTTTSKNSANSNLSNIGSTNNRDALASGGDVVFTCGHIISEKRFSQSTIPLFRDKMAKFPIPLPLTVKLLVMDFQSSTCSTACPPCVYNHLREKHAPTLERWNPQ
jgi:alpha-tubulin suppressor-like RCC1 family protein